MAIQSCCLSCARAGGACEYHRGTCARCHLAQVPKDRLPGGAQLCHKERHNHAVPRDWERPKSQGRTSHEVSYPVCPAANVGKGGHLRAARDGSTAPTQSPALQPGTCTRAVKSITNQPKPKLFLLMTSQILLQQPQCNNHSVLEPQPQGKPLIPHLQMPESPQVPTAETPGPLGAEGSREFGNLTEEP